jgi:hypothetical protein
MICTLSIRAQPESSSVLDFKVPMIPFIPVVNILVNVYLMVALPWSIWLKLLVWLGVGYFIYFTYGIHNSTEGDKNGNKATKLGLNGNENGNSQMDQLLNSEKKNIS